MATSAWFRRRCVRQFAALALGGALLGACGCIPVGWLPDSSGFVYTAGKDFDRLIHYDLVMGQRRVLVEKMPAHAPTVALSPDGKRIAVAHLRRGQDRSKPETMQVLLYDLQGKLVHQSPEFHWGTNRRKGEADFPNTGVFWVASAGVLVVQDYGEPGRTGIYDLQKDTLPHLLDGTPCVYGGTPVRPDGKGFLLLGGVPPEPPEPELFLVDWQGKKQSIALKRQGKDEETFPDSISGLLLFPWKGTSQWQGHVALVTSGTLRIRIDTEKQTGLIDELRAADATVDGKELLQHYAFAKGGIQLRLVLAEKTKSPNALADEILHLHLEMIRPGKKKAKLLLKLQNGCCCLSPSPDRKWVAIRSMSDNTSAAEVLLVSETGQVREIPGERKD